MSPKLPDDRLPDQMVRRETGLFKTGDKTPANIAMADGL
jgi:hypothetical protein